MEEHFKNKLKNHKVDWDKEELLGNLQKELSQKKSRFNRRWLWLLPLLFIGTCWSVSDFNFSSESDANLETTESAEISDAKIENNQMDIDNATQTVDDITVIADSDVNDLNENQRTQRTQTTHSTPSKNKETKFGNSNLSKQKSILNQNAFVNFNSTLLNSGVVSSKNDFTKIETQNPTKSMALLPNLEIGALQLDMEFEPKLTLPELDTSPPKEIERMVDVKNYFFASAGGDVGLINRTVRSLSDDIDFNDAFLENKKTVNARFLLSTNFKIGYQHQSGWSLQSGLGYNNIVEFFKFEDTLGVSSVDVWNEKAYYLLGPLDTLFLGDTVSLLNAEIRKVQHNNFHTYFNIPIEVGYRHEFGKINVFGTAGISFAFANKFKGRESQLLEANIRRVIDNPIYTFKNRIGFQLGCGAEYPFSKRTNAFMKMTYRRTPTLLFSEVGEQFYQSVSLGVGLKYSLF